MKRCIHNPIKQPDAIVASDLHLREDIPICRGGDFFIEQTNKLIWLSDLQEKYQCPVLVPGDIFHKWKPSPFLLSWAIENLPDDMIVIPGQHDLPQHNIDNLNKAGLYVLEKAKKLKILSEGETININYGVTVHGFPFGSKLKGIPSKENIINIAMCHTLTWMKEKPFPNCISDDGTKLLCKMEGFNLLLVGDNHKSFIAKKENRLLLSPGSLMRQSADQIDFRPRVYLYYAETNTVEAVYLPIKSNVVSREHLDRSSERSERIDAFISKLDGEWQAGLSYEANLEEFFKRNRVRKQTKEICYKAIES